MDDFSPNAKVSAAHTHVPPAQGHGDGHGGHDDQGHEHHELGFIRTYLFSTDHKTIGVQYLIAGLTLLFFGFLLMLLMRWQLAFPGEALTWANASNHIGYQFRRSVITSGSAACLQSPLPFRPILIIRRCSSLFLAGTRCPAAS